MKRWSSAGCTSCVRGAKLDFFYLFIYSSDLPRLCTCRLLACLDFFFLWGSFLFLSCLKERKGLRLVGGGYQRNHVSGLTCRYIHTYVCIHTYVYIHTYTRTYINTYTYTHTNTHTHIHIHRRSDQSRRAARKHEKTSFRKRW